MRFLRRLADKDLALDRAMIPLGSCTMKLNAAAEMMPVSWPSVANLHPFAPAAHCRRLPRHDRRSGALAGRNHRLRRASRCSPMPAARANMPACWPSAASTPSRGEAQPQRLPDPLLRARHQSGERQHGRHARRRRAPATEAGDIDVDDLKAKVAEHAANLAALMITYPSTHGVFEEGVRDICALVHRAWRPGLSRRRQPQRAGRAGAAGRHRRRRLPHEPAQDLLHSAWRRRAGRRPDRRQGASAAVPARAMSRKDRRMR